MKERSLYGSDPSIALIHLLNLVIYSTNWVFVEVRKTDELGSYNILKIMYDPSLQGKENQKNCCSCSHLMLCTVD